MLPNLELSQVVILVAINCGYVELRKTPISRDFSQFYVVFVEAKFVTFGRFLVKIGHQNASKTMLIYAIMLTFTLVIGLWNIHLGFCRHNSKNSAHSLATMEPQQLPKAEVSDHGFAIS